MSSPPIPDPDRPDDWFRTFTPNQRNRPEGNGSRGERSKCSSIGLEVSPGVSKGNAFFTTGFTSQDAVSFDPIMMTNLRNMELISVASAGQGHMPLPNLWPYEVETYNIQAEPAWYGGPLPGISGLTGQALRDALYGPSPNEFLAGSYDLFLAVGYSMGNPVHLQGVHLDGEYFDYRMICHMKCLLDLPIVCTYPDSHFYLASHGHKYWLETYGYRTLDPGAPLSGNVSDLMIPDAVAQATVGAYPGNNGQPYIDPTGKKYVVVDVRDPAERASWFATMQGALENLILRDDGTFEDLMNATEYGWHYITESLGSWASADPYRIMIVYS